MIKTGPVQRQSGAEPCLRPAGRQGVEQAELSWPCRATHSKSLPLIRKRDFVGLAALAAVFVAIGLARLPLPAVLSVAIPISIAITFAMGRGAKA